MSNIFFFDVSMPLNEALAILFHSLTFKEEVKCDINEGVRVSSLMVSVGIILSSS